MGLINLSGFQIYKELCRSAWSKCELAGRRCCGRYINESDLWYLALHMQRQGIRSEHDHFIPQQLRMPCQQLVSLHFVKLTVH